MSRLLPWWRHVALGGIVGGLLAAIPLQAPAGWLPLCPLLVLALGRLRPRPGRAAPALGALAWLTAIAAVGALAGLGIGDARLRSLAAGAVDGEPGSAAVARGYLTAPPKRSGGELRVPLRTADGRLMLVSDGAGAGLSTGDEVRARGTLAEPEPWRAAEVERSGARLELRAERVALLEGSRRGIAGALDRARVRAERALSAGLDRPQAALARGFVLGQDDRIDPRTREQFKRSGLAHLLAVSGQNVMLLAALVGVLFALAGIGPRLRLLLILVMIALYVPVAGAGPSIQRAGVMGAAGIAATLAGRAADRAYLPLLAAVVTLTLNPLAAGDVGWQLSFAAVIGIALWAAPLRDRLQPAAARLVGARVGRPLAEGAALTLAATVATAPLMTHHFESFSAASIPANLLVLWAVPPVMWVGMLAALLGQVPLVPTAPLALVEGPLLSYVALIADLLSRPDWALVRLPLSSVRGLLATYAALLAGMATLLAALRRRAGASPPAKLRAGFALALFAIAVALAAPRAPIAPSSGQLRLTMLDVGQGDALLLEPPDAPPLLVDTGPPGGDVAAALRERGVERLAAVFITHDQLDHAGAIGEVLATAKVGRLFVARPAPGAEAAARAEGTPSVRVDEGTSLRFGSLALEVLWPRSGGVVAADPNAESLVMAARFGAWSALLPGDAEAEANRLDPGPLDLLKLAHHGSADAGLGPLLDRSAPRVALIGVGSDNPHGHPSDAALAELEQRRVCVLRTDLDGDVWVELGAGGLALGSEHGDPSRRPGCRPEP